MFVVTLCVSSRSGLDQGLRREAPSWHFVTVEFRLSHDTCTSQDDALLWRSLDPSCEVVAVHTAQHALSVTDAAWCKHGFLWIASFRLITLFASPSNSRLRDRSSTWQLQYAPRIPKVAARKTLAAASDGISSTGPTAVRIWPGPGMSSPGVCATTTASGAALAPTPSPRPPSTSGLLRRPASSTRPAVLAAALPSPPSPRVPTTQLAESSTSSSQVQSSEDMFPWPGSPRQRGCPPPPPAYYAPAPVVYAVPPPPPPVVYEIPAPAPVIYEVPPPAPVVYAAPPPVVYEVPPPVYYECSPPPSPHFHHHHHHGW
ncbi:unnamed protein product [Phytophthora fragariaefolia]|uniref:Unnamed protein product n=1 Tax=Phytophthora fragariaefolia TaxID=1490495 RepID=A0A9W6Y068_9STRA|nr:unnamed protein product [Phytophthora fragariaefolia]